MFKNRLSFSGTRVSRSIWPAVILMMAIFCGGLASAQSPPVVVVTIKPLHSLVAAIMRGAAEPRLLISGIGSPHDFSLKPSQAQSLQNADMIVWVGPELESFLKDAIPALSKNGASLEAGRLFSDRPENEHSDHDDHKEEPEDKDHGHEEHDHAAEGGDPHIWLDPVKAIAIVENATARLIEIDSKNGRIYQQNSKDLINEINNLTRNIQSRIAAFKTKDYLVFHDAYSHFSDRFGLRHATAVTINPSIKPGAGRLRELQDLVRDRNITCAFSEPQFDDRFLKTIISSVPVRIGFLDPLGAKVSPGPAAYRIILNGITQALVNCFDHK